MELLEVFDHLKKYILVCDQEAWFTGISEISQVYVNCGPWGPHFRSFLPRIESKCVNI